jgi:hypothetical protein
VTTIGTALAEPRLSRPSSPLRRLGPTAVVLAIFTVCAAVNLQLPLYAAYGDAAGYGQGLRAVAFATYVLGLIPVLALLGGISDRLGRRSMLIAALAMAGVATAMMQRSPTIHALFPARVLQGAGVAVVMAAGAACLAELFEGPAAAQRAAFWTALSSSLGFGGGALATSACLAAGRSLEPASFSVELGLVAIGIAAVAAIPARAAAAGAAPFTIAAVIAWATSGVIVGLLSSELSRLGRGSWSGVALFLLTGSGALIQLAPRLRPASVAGGLRAGAACTMLGCTLFTAGVWLGQPLLLVVAAACSGASGFGYTYVAGLTAVTVAAGPQRARAVSGFLLWSYVGFGLPSVLVGLIADRTGLPQALAGFSLVVLSTWTWLLTRLARRGRSMPEPSSPIPGGDARQDGRG